MDRSVIAASPSNQPKFRYWSNRPFDVIGGTVDDDAADIGVVQQPRLNVNLRLAVADVAPFRSGRFARQLRLEVERSPMPVLDTSSLNSFGLALSNNLMTVISWLSTSDIGNLHVALDFLCGHARRRRGFAN